MHPTKRSVRAAFTACVLTAASACDGGPQPGITAAPAGTVLRTAADSAAALRHNLASPRVRRDVFAAEAGIPVQAGQRLVITVTGAESSRCEDVSVTGAISQLAIHEVGGCYGDPHYGIGKQVTTAGAIAAGTVNVIMSTGAGGTGLTQVSGSYPDYTVALDDGLYDADYNDVVLSVHVDGGSPLKVECPAVTRGQTATCTASTADGSAFTVSKWTFEADGRTVTNVSSVKTWGGEAVIGGTVTVTATVGGHPETARTQLAVNARQWADRIPGTIEESTPNCTSYSPTCPVVYPPTVSGHLGKAVLFWEAQGRARHVNRGINEGWTYVVPRGNNDAVVVFPRRVTFLNPVLFRADDPWYAARPTCTAQMLLVWVRAHEAVHQAAFTANADGRINAHLEGFVRYGTLHDVTQLLSAEVAPGGPMDKLVRAAGDGDHTSPEFGPEPCAWGLPNDES